MAKPPGPARSIRAVPRFVKSKRRLPDTAQEEVDAQVRRLIENPLLGEPKVGALKGVRVVNPFDTPPTGRGLLRVDGERHTTNLTPCTARGMSRTVKFKVGVHQYLLAYRFFPNRNVIEVVDVGVHENFYRDLQAYLIRR